MRYFLAAGLAGVLFTGSATADEVWTSQAGEVVYAYEIDATQTAVLKVSGITMFIEGLAGVYENRGTYSGVWVLDEIPDGEEGCTVSIVRPGTEETTAYWGQVEMTFIDPDFPSIWLAETGSCFGPLDSQFVGRPVVAGSE